jgi:hypothetical protein
VAPPPVVTASGNLWMVTGGGPKDDCFGSPCTNELVEFTKAQLATSGSPTPVRTIVGAKTGMNWPSYVVTVP